MASAAWFVVQQALNFCNIPFLKNKSVDLCNACVLGKSHKLSFFASNTVYSSPLELVVADLWGSTHCFSSGYQYYVSFMDAFLDTRGFIFFEKI